MSITERQQREKALIREKIVNAATELFSQHGFEQVSMRKIAEKIEYSPTTIYNYFKNKNELLFVLLKQGYTKFFDTLKDAKEKYNNAAYEIKLKKVLQSYIEFGLTNQDYYNLMFILNIDNDDSLVGCENERWKAFEQLVFLVQEGKEIDFFQTSDEMLTSQIIWAKLHGITSLLITSAHFPWAEKELLIDTYLDSLIAGVKKGSF